MNNWAKRTGGHSQRVEKRRRDRMDSVSALKMFVLLIIVAASLFLAGCAGRQQPRAPVVVSSTPASEYTKAAYDSDLNEYKKAIQDESWEKALRLRNAMIDKTLVDVEISYHEFELKIASSRAIEQVAGDFVELATTASIDIVKGERVKDILAISLSTLKGGRLSIDKNFFRQKTIDLVVSKMRGLRDEVRGQIKRKEAFLDVHEYPFEQAWLDLIDYFYAGTLQNALVALANDTGQEAEDAREERKSTEKQIVERQITTKEQFDDLSKIREKLDQLFEAICVNPNCSAMKPDDTAREAEQEARKALTELGGSSDSSIPILQVLNGLRTELQKAGEMTMAEESKRYQEFKKALGIE